MEGNTKHICILGSGISGLGKGIVSSSVGRLLKSYGLSITMQKLDPYFNINSGTLAPIEHGECYVTYDGKECDLDLGHYERFIDEQLSKDCSLTSGLIYSNVLQNEKEGKYLGHTCQIIPHVTNEILDKMHEFDGKYDIVLHEIGGTVGDMESLPYVESVRQLRYENKKNTIIILLTYLPYLKTSQEVKTKVAQQGVEKLRALGLVPDILVCRTEEDIDDSIKNKLAMFCNVDKDCVIKNMDVPSIYSVPEMLKQEGIVSAINEKLDLDLDNKYSNFDEWNKIVTDTYTPDSITIGLVGKYTALHDAYLSVTESLKFAGWENKVNVNIEWIDSEEIESDITYLDNLKLNGIIIPGGFGDRGIEGMILAAKYAREKNIPFMGICLGMQVASIEFARNVLHLVDANSEEFNQKSTNKVIHIMENQKNISDKSGTMRLGNYQCVIKDATMTFDAYNKKCITERHRHRFEFNNDYRDAFEKNGMHIVGTSPNNELVEIIELENHPFFVACQYHPEFLSRPGDSEPLFKSFIFYSKNINKKTSI
jgi:CTP synthase